jgi:hypothetical protein
MAESTLDFGAPKSYPAVSNSDAAQLSAERNRVAVLVLHGMGQQRKFETLSSVANGIESVAGPAAKKEARNVRVGDERLSRLEMTLADGREVDIYESYWAPITEGQVTLRDVMAFLWNGARNGIANARKPFRRWIFGHHVAMDGGGRTLLYLILAAGVLASLMFMNTLIVTLGAGRALDSGPEWLKRVGLIEDLTATVLMFLFCAAGFAATYLAAAHQKKPGAQRHLAISRFGLYYFFALCFETIAVAVAMFLAIGMYRNMYWATAANFGAVIVTATTIIALVGAALVILISLAGSQKRLLDLLAVVSCGLLAAAALLLASGRAASEPASMFSMAPQVDGGFASTVVMWIAARWVAIWVALAWVSKQIRGFLVQYVGDVAAYVSPSALDRFDAIRERIKDCSFKTANAIYRAEHDGQFLYRNVAVIGHSLGSVVAYDCINRMLNEDAHCDGGLRVLDRTTGLVTFGSPLDKTAFLFETNTTEKGATRAALAATVQPLVADTRTLSMPWSNVYSPWDIISGSLDFYGTNAAGGNRVTNLIDYEAVTPLGAHTAYWANKLVWQRLDSILPAAAPALADRSTQRRTA